MLTKAQPLAGIRPQKTWMRFDPFKGMRITSFSYKQKKMHYQNTKIYFESNFYTIDFHKFK
ncbi:hypothetical protein SAMN04488104_100848 [Algoriphagus faecimaris]|uniref:Uncharacterized protein n=1 Tax=Algoriphagus faecimaris TaxID=686796 RepID=A0A1G6Q4R5_9BACT|nr:hypothetical protein SAMN04488104_100848 [Algoriphagus faecimaris]